MAIYHFTAETGTRAGGQSAVVKSDYISRFGKYRQQSDKLVYLISENMPIWAIRKPRSYWNAADEHERVNARLFKEIEIALPLELTHLQRVDLAESFSRRVTTVPGGRLPFTLGLHEGKRKVPGGSDNPHMHLEISERVNDGHPRSAELWFRRAAVGKGKTPADGGAPKTDQLKPKAWLEDVRRLWADMCNEALEAAGHEVRIDHRSLIDQGIERAPQVHLGPRAAGVEARTSQASRRRLEVEQRQAIELEEAGALKRRATQLRAEVETERRQAIRLRQVADELELLERPPVARAPMPAPAWTETVEGLDLASPLHFPDTRQPGGPYRAKTLSSGVVLHLRMPEDRVAFVERQDRIRMAATDALEPESVSQAIAVACARWGTVMVTGSSAFRRLVIEEASQMGLLDQLDGLTDVERHHGSAVAKRRGPR